MTPLVLSTAHWVASIVVLAEALNKLERADLFAGRMGLCRLWAMRWLFVPWWWQRKHIVTFLKVCGWACLAIGAGGGLMTPFLGGMTVAPAHEVAVMVGFALLIIRTRVKEGGQ